MPSGNGQNGMMSALWEMGCEEDSDYHQVVLDGISGQGCGPVCQVRVVEGQVRLIERAEKRSTPQGSPIQRIHSEGMYLVLQGARILVGFLKVSAVVQQKECMHAV